MNYQKYYKTTIQNDQLRQAFLSWQGITDLIAKNGTLGEVEEWGKKKLAYPINYETEGFYTLINFSSEESFPAELDRVINITDGVLRSLIVAKGE